jgi:signal transduction histidine kinase
MNLDKLRLKWKVFAFLLCFCALLLTILWLFQTVFLDSFYRSIKVMEIKSSASSIEKNIDNTNLSNLITGISQDSDVSIEVMSENGEIIYTAEVRKDSPIHKLPVSEKLDLLQSAESNNGEYIEYVSSDPRPSNANNGFVGGPGDNKPSHSLIYVKIVQTVSGESLAVLINSEISPVNATVTTLRYQLYFVTGIMIILAIFLALIIAKRVSKPIEEINKSAKILAEGNYQTNFNGKGFLEISELSDTLNTAAAELSKVESLRRELMANISHDLRTPLSFIYSYAEIMHDFPGEITPEQTQIIMDETKRLTSLVNDIFDISKLEIGIEQLNTVEFNLTKSLQKTTLRISELIKKDHYHLSFVYDKEVSVCADEIKITQAYYNLLVNAINYTGDNKSIVAQQVIADGKVRIEVTDTGEGISAENLPYIWDRYYKVDKKHKRAITGTGLGLSIVRKVIELHGGEYGVDSQLGKGSTFWFSLIIN